RLVASLKTGRNVQNLPAKACRVALAPGGWVPKTPTILLNAGGLQHGDVKTGRKCQDSSQHETGGQPAGPGTTDNGDVVGGGIFNAGKIRAKRHNAFISQDGESRSAAVETP